GPRAQGLPPRGARAGGDADRADPARPDRAALLERGDARLGHRRVDVRRLGGRGLDRGPVRDVHGDRRIAAAWTRGPVYPARAVLRPSTSSISAMRSGGSGPCSSAPAFSSAWATVLNPG